MQKLKLPLSLEPVGFTLWAASNADLAPTLDLALLILGMKTGRDDWEFCSQSSRSSAMP